MIYVSLSELLVIVLLAYGAWGILRSQQREHNRRENLLLNQVLHAAGNPWQPAPADTRTLERPDWDELLEERLAMNYGRFTTTPEQEP